MDKEANGMLIKQMFKGSLSKGQIILVMLAGKMHELVVSGVSVQVIISY
jgi:hypothetical protein